MSKTVEQAWRKHGVDDDQPAHEYFVYGWDAHKEQADAEIAMWQDRATEAQAERDAAREERDGLRKDAERYRWLRSKPLGWSIEHEIHGWVTTYGRDELNDQIDAAIAKDKP